MESLLSLNITKERIDVALKSNNTEAFKVMLRLIMMSDKVPIAPFMQYYRELRESNEPNSTPSFKEDMGDWIWKLKATEIPPPEITYGCPECNVHFTTEKEWWEHRRTHETKIMDISPAKDAVRAKIEETTMVAVSEAEEYNVDNRIMRCPVPGCSFCCTSMDDLEHHRESMQTNDLHTEFRTWVRKLGPFYGAGTFLTRRNHQIPTISDFLGQTTGAVTICSTCYSIIHGKHQAVENHYKRANHVLRKNQRAFKVSIFERPAQATVLESHYNILVNRDKRLPDELMEKAQCNAAQEEEKILTPEEQEREEEASRIRLEGISAETARLTQEAQRRMIEIARLENEEAETQETSQEQNERSHEETAGTAEKTATEDNQPDTSEPSEDETDISESMEEEQSSQSQRRRERERNRIDQETDRANQIVVWRAEVEEAQQDEERKKKNKALQWREDDWRRCLVQHAAR